MNELELLRKKIDTIDEEIIALFEERMDTVCNIAKYKLKNNLPVLSQGREKEVIQKAVDNLKNKNYSESVQTFIKEIMEISKEEQNKIFSDEKLV